MVLAFPGTKRQWSSHLSAVQHWSCWLPPLQWHREHGNMADRCGWSDKANGHVKSELWCSTSFSVPERRDFTYYVGVLWQSIFQHSCNFLEEKLPHLYTAARTAWQLASQQRGKFVRGQRSNLVRRGQKCGVRGISSLLGTRTLRKQKRLLYWLTEEQAYSERLKPQGHPGTFPVESWASVGPLQMTKYMVSTFTTFWNLPLCSFNITNYIHLLTPWHRLVSAKEDKHDEAENFLANHNIIARG